MSKQFQTIVVGDIINLSTPAGKLIMNAEVIRYSDFGYGLHKLRWRNADGILCVESFDLKKCGWAVKREALLQQRLAA